jgi:hypothetical protein
MTNDEYKPKTNDEWHILSAERAAEPSWLSGGLVNKGLNSVFISRFSSLTYD